MDRFQKFAFFLARISLGWLFFYAGIAKILNPKWSAAGYLAGAKTLSGFYGWLASPANIGWVNFLNEWGLALIGLSLILGLFVRLSSAGGMAMMVLYYLPVLQFPYPNANSFLVDEHIVYASVFLLLIATGAGRAWGLYGWCSGLPICSKFPRLREWLG